MRVKIGETIYDSNEQPIMLIFDDGEQKLIGDMAPDLKKFCSYPPGRDPKDIEKFMEFGEDNDE
jgi:hypothetical protein